MGSLNWAWLSHCSRWVCPFNPKENVCVCYGCMLAWMYTCLDEWMYAYTYVRFFVCVYEMKIAYDIHHAKTFRCSHSVSFFRYHSRHLCAGPWRRTEDWRCSWNRWLAGNSVGTPSWPLAELWNLPNPESPYFTPHHINCCSSLEGQHISCFGERKKLWNGYNHLAFFRIKGSTWNHTTPVRIIQICTWTTWKTSLNTFPQVWSTNRGEVPSTGFLVTTCHPICLVST